MEVLVSRIGSPDQTSSEVLMESLEQVEKAKGVAVLFEENSAIMVKSNLTHKDLYWLLAQAMHTVMKDLFAPDDD